MAPQNEGEGAPAAPAVDDKQKGRGVADYLNAPRKKRKSYVVVACGKGVSADLRSSIDQFVKAQFKTLALAHPKTPEELAKQSTRQIVLMIFDDEFAGLEQGLTLLRDLKAKKQEVPVPVLFLTSDPEELINAYNKVLLPYQEADEYINHAKSTPTHILSKIRSCLTNSNRRRSRRYKVEIPLTYFDLNDDAFLKGTLIDLSIHGALLKADQGRIFKLGDQVKLHIPTAIFLGPSEGDYLKVSAKVRRVFIGGSEAGISFEHVSDKQLFTLTRFLTELVNSQNARRMQGMKIKAAQRG